MGYKKLDEVMELLHDELDEFNHAINKLEQLTQNVENIKIKADTSAIEYRLQEHLKTEKETNHKTQEAIRNIEKQLSKARVIPKIQLWIHYGIYIISLIIVGYLLFTKTQLNNLHKKNFMEIEENANSRLNEYFEAHPEAFQTYQKWLSGKEGISNQK